jgi:uncharacterized protein YbaP (TraB family)
MWHFNRYLQRLVLTLIFWLTSIASFADVASGLLWRIQKPQHPANYLFGTIHVDDKRVKRLNKNIKHHFNESKTLCLEILPNKQTQQGIGLAMLLPEDFFLDDVLGELLFNRVSLEMNKKGMTPLETIRLKPWAAMILLSRPESQSGYTLDEQLYHWGVDQNKKLCALESLSEQLAIFDHLSRQDQISLLTDSLENLSVMKDLNEKLIQSYLSGSLDNIYQQSLEMEIGNSELSISLREQLIDQRNSMMADRLVSVLNEGYAFVAVGALHLPGKQGLLHLLREKGFIVTAPSMPVHPW